MRGTVLYGPRDVGASPTLTARQSDSVPTRRSFHQKRVALDPPLSKNHSLKNHSLKNHSLKNRSLKNRSLKNRSLRNRFLTKHFLSNRRLRALHPLLISRRSARSDW